MELDAVHRVFSNARERVQQKLNLLDIWATQVDSPIVPWRVTEILESLEDEGLPLGSEPYRKVLGLWRQTERLFPPKVLDIAVRCPAFHPELLQLQAELLQQYARYTSGDEHASTIVATHSLHWTKTVESRFDEVPEIDLMPLCERVVELVPDTLDFFHFVLFLMNRNVVVTQPIVDVVFRSIHKDHDPSQVRQFMTLLGNDTKAETFQLGIEWYLNREEQDAARELLKKAVTTIADRNNKERPQEISGLLSAFVARQATSMDDVRVLLDEIEGLLLLDKDDQAEMNPSPIPYEFYRGLIPRFSLQQNAGQFGAWMDRLLCHHRRGFSDLHPRLDIAQSFSSVLRREQGLDSLDRRVQVVLDLASRCESGSAGGEDVRKYTPNYIMFDFLIGDLEQRSKTAQSKQATREQSRSSNLLESTSRQATTLLETMHRLHVAPEEKTRPFVFNSTMAMVLRCHNKHMHFRAIMTLKRYMMDLEIQPNRITVDHQLRACELASVPSNQKQAFWGWRMMVIALSEARQSGMADVGVYRRCFQVMLANERVEPRRAAKKLKILELVFACCCTDGALTDFALDAFLQLAPKEMNERLYQQRLLKGNVVPREWQENTRVAPKLTSPRPAKSVLTQEDPQ